MSWKLKRKAQSLLAGEEGQVHKDWGGRMSIALVYPNSYAVGMSNLGFQTIYEHLNAIPDAVCERVFFPDPEDLEEQRRSGTAPFSLESLLPLKDFDLIGFSVTYEGDYINAVRLLAMAGIPLWACARSPIPSPWPPSWTPSPWGRARSWWARSWRRGARAGQRQGSAGGAASSSAWSRWAASTCRAPSRSATRRTE